MTPNWIPSRPLAEGETVDDHRVQSDDARAAHVMANLKEGEAVCIECGGTGNEFLFMYRACSQCVGTGIVRQRV